MFDSSSSVHRVTLYGMTHTALSHASSVGHNLPGRDIHWILLQQINWGPLDCMFHPSCGTTFFILISILPIPMQYTVIYMA
jgi:hypothetical protein